MKIFSRKLYIICCFFTLQAYSLSAQEIDIVRIENLIKKSISYKVIDLDSSIYFAKQAQLEAEIIKNKHLEQEAKYHIGYYLHQKENFEEALDILLPLQVELIKQKSSPEFISKMFQKIGECYRDLKQSLKALEYLFMVADILENETESKDNDYWLADIYTNIAICYGKSERHENAANFIKKTMAIHAKYNDKDKLIRDYNNIGYTLFRLGEFKESEELLLEGLKLDKENGFLNESLSELYLVLKQNDKSLIHAVKAYNKASKLKQNGRIKFGKELILSNLNVKEILLDENDSLKLIEPEDQKVSIAESVSVKKSITIKDYFLILLLISNLVLLIILIKRKKY